MPVRPDPVPERVVFLPWWGRLYNGKFDVRRPRNIIYDDKKEDK